jgi:hypothetical protein
VTTDSVTALRELFDAWNRGELVYFGVAGVTDFWSQWLPMWKRLTVEVRWTEGCGERARAWVHQSRSAMRAESS